MMKHLLALLIIFIYAIGSTAFSAVETGDEQEESIEEPSKFIRHTSVLNAKPTGDSQPWKILRSIQLSQDKIVSGEAGAIEAYRNLLLGAAEKMMQLDDEVWQHERNLDAVAIYVLIGGDVELGYKALRKTKVELSSKILLQAAIAYSERDARTANGLFERIDHTSLPPSMSAQVALAKSMVLSSADLEIAAFYLKDARKYAPGTLVEEAAIRRSTRIAGLLKDPADISQLLKTYLFRFSNSYYFNDFLKNISFALVGIQDESGMNVVPEFKLLLAKLTTARRLAVGEYAMRQAVVEGRFEFVNWLSEQVLNDAKAGSETHSRLRLYDLAARVASENNTDIALKEIEKIPRNQLSESDQKILDAVKSTGLTITAADFTDELRREEGGDDKPVTAAPEEEIVAGGAELSGQVTRFENQLEEMKELIESEVK